MQITLIDQPTCDELAKLYLDNPELRFQNVGYEYLSSEVREKKAAEIARISEILKKHVTGFVKFFNFRTSRNGDIVMRFDYGWNADTPGAMQFTGVGYLPLEHLRHGFPVNTPGLETTTITT